jgi:thiamine-monophosphate kinase
MERTELSELGEFGLIKHIGEGLKSQNSSTIKALGDDAAVVKSGEGLRLMSTDMLIEGVHFDLSYAPLKHLGYKAAIVNFSDIYAMNGMPTHMMISLGVSNRFSVEAIDELYSGIKLAGELYGVDIVGGDTVSSGSGLVINIAVYGEVSEEKVTYRSGAKHNDLLVVSGDLGAAYMGLQILEREKAVFQSTPGVQPDLEGHDYILERQLKPEARKDVVEMLDKLGVKPTAMIDISDGLASEVLHLSDQSNLGFVVYDEKLPIDPTVITAAEEFKLDPSLCALNGGEDYELLFTIDQGDFEKLKGSPHFSFIGHAIEGSKSQLVAKDGTSHDLTAQGWDAFIKKQQEES